MLGTIEGLLVTPVIGDCPNQALIMHELLLSVVLPNYDHAYYLSRAIDAIAAQDGSLDEIIVVDDVSTDDSRDVLAQCQTQYPNLAVLCNERDFGELPDHALTDCWQEKTLWADGIEVVPEPIATWHIHADSLSRSDQRDRARRVISWSKSGISDEPFSQHPHRGLKWDGC